MTISAKLMVLSDNEDSFSSFSRAQKTIRGQNWYLKHLFVSRGCEVTALWKQQFCECCSQPTLLLIGDLHCHLTEVTNKVRPLPLPLQDQQD